MKGFLISKQESNEIFCESCGHKNEVDIIGSEISIHEIDGFHYNFETEKLTFDYPIWANFDCRYCGHYHGYAFIENINIEIKTIND